MKKFILLFGIILLLGSCRSYCKLWGDYSLGDNFSLMVGDGDKDKLIVYCLGRDCGCCKSGIPVIPSRKDSNTRYINNASSDNRWIIAEGVNYDNSKSYWIVDKGFVINNDDKKNKKQDSIIQTHVTGPMDSELFYKRLQELKIDLKFE